MRLRFLSAHKNYTHTFHIREVQSYVYNEHTWHHPPVTLKGRESQKFILATKSSSRSIFISASITRNLLCNFSHFQENTSCLCTEKRQEISSTDLMSPLVTGSQVKPSSCSQPGGVGSPYFTKLDQSSVKCSDASISPWLRVLLSPRKGPTQSRAHQHG